MAISYFYAATLCFFLGVFVATFFEVSLSTSTWIFSLGFFLTVLWYRRPKEVSATTVLFVAICVLSSALGLLRYEIADRQFELESESFSLPSKREISGVVIAPPDVREQMVLLTVKTQNGSILVSTDRYTEVSYGDLVLVNGTLSKPESFTTDFGRVFNYPGYLKAKNITHQVAFAEVEVLAHDQGNIVLATLFALKQQFQNSIKRALPDPLSGLGEGMLLGVKQALGEDLEDAFRKTGIIHIVVLSGYNVMLVVIFVMYILGYFLPARPRLIFGLLAILCFSLLVGMSASVVRASIMACILLIVQYTGRTYMMFRALMLAGLVMVIENPFLLVYDVGFQLSFLATLGLILIAPQLEYLLQGITHFESIRKIFVATIATQIAVLPLLLYQIGQFSAVSVVVNMLVLPMVPVAMLCTFIVGIVEIILPVATPLFAFLAYAALRYIAEIALWFGDLSFAAYVTPPFSFFVVPLAYGILGFILWWFYKPGMEAKYSEIAEEMLLKTSEDKLIQKEIRTKWVIEEEFDTDVTTEKAATNVRVTASKETPIFFR